MICALASRWTGLNMSEQAPGTEQKLLTIQRSTKTWPLTLGVTSNKMRGTQTTIINLLYTPANHEQTLLYSIKHVLNYNNNGKKL